VQGRVWHKALEYNYSQKIESDTDLPLDEVQDFYVDTLDDVFSTEEVQLEPGEKPGILKDEGTAIVAIHHKNIAPLVKPALVEERFNIDLGDDFPFTLMGIWDIIERDGTLADNKSLKRTPNQSDTDKDLQLTAYATAYRKVYQKLPTALRIDAAIKKKNPSTKQIITQRTDDECEWFINTLVHNVGRSIINEAFHPNPNGWHCDPRFCGYWGQCKGGSK
jgi:hypothetical protein